MEDCPAHCLEERLLGGICIWKRSHTLSSWSFKLYTESFNKSCNKETHLTGFFKLMGPQIQAFVYRLLTSSHNQPPTEHPKGKAELGDKPIGRFWPETAPQKAACNWDPDVGRPAASDPIRRSTQGSILCTFGTCEHV